jgi:hypothetical protein
MKWRVPMRQAAGALRPKIRCLAAGLFIVFALTGVSVFAADFGILLGTEGEYTKNTAEADFGFTGNFVPWFSMSAGRSVSVYVSGKFAFKYGYGDESWAWPPLVELGRTEFSFRPGQTVYLTLGRQRFNDPGEMIASGLFDGLNGSFSLGRARLRGGLFYTGLLYKETAEILMTPGDAEYYHRPLDYGDTRSYFASRRIFASMAGEFPDFTSRTSLLLSVLAQFDINDYEEALLHSQYLEARYGIDATDFLRFFVTGIGGLTENERADVKINFAASVKAEWELPGGAPDMLLAELRWGSGSVNDTIGPFVPLSGIAQGVVFRPTLPGTMNARASYTVRPHNVISVSLAAAHFGRTDLETFRDGDLDPASKDRFLGGELSAQLIWAPQSTIRLNTEGAIFFPGGAFTENTETKWKIKAGLSVSL